MKKILAIGVLILLVIPNLAFASDEFTEEDIALRFKKISETYEIGEPFSKEDSEFVIKYAAPTKLGGKINEIDLTNIDEEVKRIYDLGDTLQPNALQDDYYRIHANNYDTDRGQIDGQIHVEINISNNTLNVPYMTTRTYSSYGTANTIQQEVTLEAYGVVGQDGWIGKIADAKVDSRCSNTDECTMSNKFDNFTGSVLFYNLYGKGTIDNRDIETTIIKLN